MVKVLQQKQMAFSLTPLLDAPWTIQVHTALAIAAFVFGIIQLAGAKGTTRHRIIGYAWSLCMMVVAGTSIFINVINGPGHFSLIHLFTILVLVTLPLAILDARRGNIARHRRRMKILFFGALVIAGAFTLIPGRLLHTVLFGE
jgi:uncharacterized membrane protein